jgi:hypothetical protein
MPKFGVWSGRGPVVKEEGPIDGAFRVVVGGGRRGILYLAKEAQHKLGR